MVFEKLKEIAEVLKALEGLDDTTKTQIGAVLSADKYVFRTITKQEKATRRGINVIRSAIRTVSDNIRNKIYGVAKVLVIKYVALIESGKINGLDDLRANITWELENIRNAIDYIYRYYQAWYGEKLAERRIERRAIIRL